RGTGGTWLGGARALKDRMRLAVPAGEDRKHEAGGEEHRRKRSGGGRQHVGAAAAGQKPARAAAHAEPAAFRALQQDDARHGQNDHEVDHDDDGLHLPKSRSTARRRRPAPDFSSPAYRKPGLSTRSPAAFPLSTEPWRSSVGGGDGEKIF